MLYTRVGLIHLAATQSDHCPILLDIVADRDNNPRPFKFFSAWFRDQSCKEVIKEAWQHSYYGSPAYQLIQKGKPVKDHLRKWNHDTFGYTQVRIRQLTTQLEFLRSQPAIVDNIQLERHIEQELDEQFTREEDM